MKKQIDEQLSKVSKVIPIKGKRATDILPNNNIILNQIQTSREIASSTRDIAKEKETFY